MTTGTSHERLKKQLQDKAEKLQKKIEGKRAKLEEEIKPLQEELDLTNQMLAPLLPKEQSAESEAA